MVKELYFHAAFALGMATATPTFAQSQEPALTQSGMVIQTLSSFAIVIAIIGLLAWWIKRSRHLLSGSKAPIKVISHLALSTREKVIVLEFQDEWFLVGSTGQQMTLLANLPKPEGADLPADSASPRSMAGEASSRAQMNFQRALQRAMGRKETGPTSPNRPDRDLP